MPRTPYLIAMPLLLAMAGSAHAAPDTRNFMIGIYDEVFIEGDMRVEISNNGAPSAKAEGDAKLVDNLKIERVGKQIRIGFRPMGAGYQQPQGSVLVKLSGRNIRKLQVRGSAQVSVDAIKASAGQFELRGSGEVRIGKVETDTMQVLVNGTGAFAIGAGSAKNGAVHLNGTANFEAPEFTFNTLTLFQQGAANVSTKAKREVTITNNGPGTITIGGSASCVIRQAGSGKIICPKTGTSK
jgi:hypothetical protein